MYHIFVATLHCIRAKLYGPMTRWIAMYIYTNMTTFLFSAPTYHQRFGEFLLVLERYNLFVCGYETASKRFCAETR